MNIHPINGGVAPLYSPLTPSFLMVCKRQSKGPLNWDIWVVCKRTFMVSNLGLGQPFFDILGRSNTKERWNTYGWPTRICGISIHVSLSVYSGRGLFLPRPYRSTSQCRRTRQPRNLYSSSDWHFGQVDLGPGPHCFHFGYPDWRRSSQLLRTWALERTVETEFCIWNLKHGGKETRTP